MIFLVLNISLNSSSELVGWMREVIPLSKTSLITSCTRETCNFHLLIASVKGLASDSRRERNPSASNCAEGRSTISTAMIFARPSSLTHTRSPAKDAERWVRSERKGRFNSPVWEIKATLESFLTTNNRHVKLPSVLWNAKTFTWREMNYTAKSDIVT